MIQIFAQLLANTVADNFRCRCYFEWAYEGGKINRSVFVVFVGYGHDAEAAKIVFERPATIGNRESSRFAKRRKAELLAEDH